MINHALECAKCHRTMKPIGRDMFACSNCQSKAKAASTALNLNAGQSTGRGVLEELEKDRQAYVRALACLAQQNGGQVEVLDATLLHMPHNAQILFMQDPQNSRVVIKVFSQDTENADGKRSGAPAQEQRSIGQGQDDDASRGGAASRHVDP